MDPDFCPPPPTEAYFNSTRGAWILSRYTDIRAALQERTLFQASPKGKVFEAVEDDAMRPQMFAKLKAEMALVHAGGWRADMEFAAKALMQEASAETEADLVGDFAHSWSIAILMCVSRAPDAVERHLAKMAACLLYEKAWSLDLRGMELPRPMQKHKEFLAMQESAEARLSSFLEQNDLSISQSMFIGVAQTLPAFLGKSWLALMRNPEQMEWLAAYPSLAPNAAIELLRFAGIVHTLYRVATKDTEIGSLRIAKGDRVDLKVASGNFDPEKFEKPYELDLSRRPQNPLSLGAGMHACAGAAMIREAFAATMPVFLAARPMLVENQQILWMGDSTLHWPLAVQVNFGGNRSDTSREHSKAATAGSC